MSTLSTTLPPESIRITTDPWTEPYWQAAKEGRLSVPRCAVCGTFRLPPTPFCPECQSQELEWVDLIGRAHVFSFSVVRGLPGSPDLVLIPVVLELEGAPGIHLVSNLIDADPESVRIGMAVEVDFVGITDSWKLPVFRSRL
jgi:uncharacterized OB-fold protein